MSTRNTEIEYRDVPGFTGYRVGSDGTIWTRHRQHNSGGRGRGFSDYLSDEWRRRMPQPDKTGYLIVSLNPGRVYRLIHRLILEAFVGPCPPGMECCCVYRIANRMTWSHVAESDDSAAMVTGGSS